MNILPKKSWHVRTKRNIERVRKDEAEAVEKELKEKKRSQAAEREARIELLRSKRFKDGSHQENTNVLGDLEKCLSGANKEHEEECKAEKEKFEKNIGLLTYLGESASSTAKAWYLDSHEKRMSKDENEKLNAKDDASKSRLDPLCKMKNYVSMKSKKESSTKKNPVKKTSSGKKSIEDLRAERLERERIERKKAESLMKRLSSSKN